MTYLVLRRLTAAQPSVALRLTQSWYFRPWLCSKSSSASFSGVFHVHLQSTSDQAYPRLYCTVPSDRYWGSGTQWFVDNLPIGGEEERIPETLIRSYGILKKNAAKVNKKYGLHPKIATAIIDAAQEVADGKLNEHFPLHLWQSTSGFHVNINVNEVIANRATKVGGEFVHPNDVDESAYFYDTFPLVMNTAFALETTSRLVPKLKSLKSKLLPGFKTLKSSLDSEVFSFVECRNRIHGREICFHIAYQIDYWSEQVSCILNELYQLAPWNTSPRQFSKGEEWFKDLVTEIATETGLKFCVGVHPNMDIRSYHAVFKLSRTLAMISLALLRADSHLIVGRQIIRMLCQEVIANDANIVINNYNPILAANTLQSIRLLSDALTWYELGPTH